MVSGPSRTSRRSENGFDSGPFRLSRAGARVAISVSLAEGPGASEGCRFRECPRVDMMPVRTTHGYRKALGNSTGETDVMSKWPIGVFTSVDAGLGVHLDVAEELKVPTVQVHAPHQGTRNQATADAFLERCSAAGITVTAVFGGFDGESYADIATTVRTVGLVPEETRAARVQEMKEISDFAKLLGCDTVALHIGFVPGRSLVRFLHRPDRGHARSSRSRRSERPAAESRDRSGDRRSSARVHQRRRAGQPVHQLRPGQHDSVRHG